MWISDSRQLKIESISLITCRIEAVSWIMKWCNNCHVYSRLKSWMNCDRSNSFSMSMDTRNTISIVHQVLWYSCSSSSVTRGLNCFKFLSRTILMRKAVTWQSSRQDFRKIKSKNSECKASFLHYLKRAEKLWTEISATFHVRNLLWFAFINILRTRVETIVNWPLCCMLKLN